MNDALGDALSIESGELLLKMEILEQGGAAHTGFKRIIGIAEGHAGICG
ncbi:hypothetical protein GKIL_3663 [Gloeobacter kilaueensis JS1]|uniref:Uncharacterized protein n=1 Tax=Gloeobacter kilaueensis (strain ATCC BAA-2537 / CCAP 1431/1 / ULC 316 / JS1) TaxID=1183438 RepID=U5QQL7_GLOK1|nr:hypothetical protein GKIL_3663 [Gloeobacter kilaueensis JS1]